MSGIDLDFCYVCEKQTEWDGEHCTGCHREWGYDTPPEFEAGGKCPDCSEGKQ